ncbi:MAG: ubiquinone/menaquinone biosynthesis methyltransferase [Thermoplasmata archaeon]|nr:ubiquinone/menaquinone biosynthesis methyltransferase [Thermoplasmata archaeon]
MTSDGGSPGAHPSLVPPSIRTASDGSPYPEREGPGFEREIRAMFASIAAGYDWFDHVASLGGDFLWRPRAFWDLDRFRRGSAPSRVLDVGCGPGHLAVLAARRFPNARVVGVDFTGAMLERARRRALPDSVRDRLAWGKANCLRLPFRSGTFDLVTSAFMVRSLSSLPEGIAELRRVLTSGGTLLTLEITEPEPGWFRALFDSFFDTVVPWLGRLVHREGPYRYLPESLKRLPDRGTMVRMFQEGGFTPVEARVQSMGIVTTFLAGVPA